MTGETCHAARCNTPGRTRRMHIVGPGGRTLEDEQWLCDAHWDALNDAMAAVMRARRGLRP